ncbi:MAG TPA: CAAX prenyl protease-related protein [Tepidisphaeraceae bacterium]|nr:CAAX prenyl protease-related protein [Tepidisphaeraceae bacterium]
MTETPSPEPRKPILRGISDFWAYIIPMGIFLILTQAGVLWPAFFPWSYVLKAVLTAIALGLLWPNYTRIRWNHWWLGVIVGVAGIVQWVGMQLFLQRFSFFKPSPDVFDPMAYFADRPAMMWAFIAIRVASAALVVPVMEELFWRDFLWREYLAPNDFKLAGVGEWDWTAFLLVSGLFATVHGNWWLTAIFWGMMIGALLVYTKSLGACIIAHGVTNLLLAIYVLYTHDWAFW